MPRGRKKKPGVRRTYQIKLYLWEGEDDDLITFLESLQPRKRASGVKFALRNGMTGTVTDNELDDEDDFDLDDFIYG